VIIQVLHVDMSGHRLQSVRRCLRLKYSVTTSKSLRQARSLFKPCSFDLVIAAHTVHKSGDGFLWLLELRQLNSAVLLINNTDKKIQADMPHVSSMCLSEPIDTITFAESIQEALLAKT